MIKNSILILAMLLLFLSKTMLAGDHPLWLRYPAISPDGKTILFNYKGDIFKVPASGGTAVPLTLSEHYEFGAVWSNDGSHVAFASDRYGNFDVFVMPATGGEAQRLTFHSNSEIPSAFSPDDQQILFSAVRQDLHTNVQYPTGAMPELYSVPVSGGRVTQILTSPAIDATYSPDGTKLIFHDQKGYEDKWRKHHTSAITRDIWTYDLATKEYTKITDYEGEDRNPVMIDNDAFYYLSEKTGSFNIHKSSLSNPSADEVVTSFKKNPVRFLTKAKDNTLCFSYDGEVYTVKPGAEPQKVNIDFAYDGRVTLGKVVPVNKGFTEFDLSPNGKEFAYVFRGEIFVSSIEHGTTKRITNTSRQERTVSFSPDGKTLLYAAETDSSWNLYSKSIIRDEEPYFFTSTVLKEETLLATEKEEFQPAYSPDGKEVAYLENRTTLKILNLASGQTRTVLSGDHNYSYADGDQYFRWSPDSKWLLVNYGPKENIFQSEVGLVKADGSGDVKNLTLSGYEDYDPRWEMKGKAMIWYTTKWADKGENGRSSEGDVYALFFTKEAYDEFNLSEEEQKLKEEKDKKKEEGDKSDNEKDKGKKKDKKDQEEDEEKVEDLRFDWDQLTDRKERLTLNTSRIGDMALSKKGDKLYYLTRFEEKYNLWENDLKKKSAKLLTKLNAESATMQLSKDGEFILVLADGKPVKVTLEDGKNSPIVTNGEMLLQHDQEREYIFEHCWRQVREKFYVADMQGVDWQYYYGEYKKFLPYINNNYDFAELLSEMLGELNASHTGGRYRPGSSGVDETASLGVLYDYAHSGVGLKVAEVLKGGPLDKDVSKVQTNDIILKIDGEDITDAVDFYSLLNRKEKKNVLLDLYRPVSGEKWQEVVKPVSLGAEYQLLYKRWVEARRDETIRLSDGKLGYVHVRSMNDASMRTVVEEVLGRFVGAEALIVDTRFNGGGNLHDQLSDFLNGKRYLDVIPHGQYVFSQPRNRWTKPSIVIVNESNYSDAHLFPVAYKIKGVGKNLGMPVPGTGTFVWWEKQIDPTIVFGIPMGGWKPVDGAFLENNQLEPDIRVPNEPGVMAEGRDQQLEAAVKELLKED
ncbi:S41 family peptidase [Mangrovibacterium lignilyticum]|uniref:S41 family peptidase n=1 Tax=Mangrovibacterium lignilyticum TaxID=2668052 RepID=UPI0013D657B9|nr:S41 family peptidase [Mangrovibacterium lignilyticum]